MEADNPFAEEAIPERDPLYRLPGDSDCPTTSPEDLEHLRTVLQALRAAHREKQARAHGA